MANSPAAGAPVATTIHTNEDGLRAGWVNVPVSGADLPVYVAQPLQVTSPPLILVVQEIFGVHDHIQDVCRRLAHAGYMAIAPQCYFRQGDASQYHDIPTLFAEIVNHVPDAQAMADLDATVAWAGTQGADLKRVGITGFCWGGRVTWLYSAHSDTIRAGVAWYGRLQGDVTAERPRHPVDVTGEMKAPVLALYGGQDTGIPMTQVSAMQSALATGSPAAQASVFHVYPDAPHAFLADYRESYREADARDGWSRMLAWFSDHLR
ncbi:dienelactone hydrolase family protein [Verticiella alkaliphila]|uniref:dienelactone hydrolase family protein n=1 Tax=Verticiella alkaliphila TaxID=2779529 RepID=UPI00209AC56F|nr:dienelactone hydrolase family protein [Verticiella sp. GG226]